MTDKVISGMWQGKKVHKKKPIWPNLSCNTNRSEPNLIVLLSILYVGQLVGICRKLLVSKLLENYLTNQTPLTNMHLNLNIEQTNKNIRSLTNIDL